MTAESQGRSPARLRLGSSEREVHFVLRPDLVALHGARPATARGQPLLSLPDGATEVVGASAVASDDPRRRGPVYAQEPTGALAVPTGRIFVRLAPAGAPADLPALLTAEGFVPVPSSHPRSTGAWVAPIGGQIEAGLAGLERLAALPGVQAVEPELLRETRRR